jgi:hypothetical protein
MTRLALVAALIGVACVSSFAAPVSAGSTDTPTRPHRPGLLWNSFPLGPHSRSTKRASAPTSPTPSASVRADARDPLIVGVLLAVMVGSAVVMLVGVPTADRVAATRWRVRRAASRLHSSGHR